MSEPRTLFQPGRHLEIDDKGSSNIFKGSSTFGLSGTTKPKIMMCGLQSIRPVMELNYTGKRVKSAKRMLSSATRSRVNTAGTNESSFD